MLRWNYRQTLIDGSRSDLAHVGFADLPGPHGSIAHQYADWGGSIGSELIPSVMKASGQDAKQAVLLRYLDAPERLHAQNFEAHLGYLREFMNTPSTDTSDIRLLQHKIQGLSELQFILRVVYEGQTKAQRNILGNESVTIDILGETVTMTRNEAIQRIGVRMGILNSELNQERQKILNGAPDHNPLPLQENPFIRHAMHFLFDPDFCSFIVRSNEIQDVLNEKKISKDEAKNRIRDLMKTIYPKLEAYWGYIYGQSGDYEELAIRYRNERVIP